MLEKIFRITFRNEDAIEQNKKLEESIDGVDGSANNLSKSLLDQEVPLAKIAAGLAAAAYSANKFFGDMDRRQSVMAAFSGSVDKAAERTGGLVSKLDLMIIKNKAAQAGLRLTEQDFGNLAVAAETFADATGGDATAAAVELTQALNTGAAEALMKYGIDIGKVTSKTEAKTKALEALSKKYGEASVAADTYGDVMRIVGNELDNMATDWSRLAGQVDLFKTNGKGLLTFFHDLRDAVDDLVGSLANFSENFAIGLEALGITKTTSMRRYVSGSQLEALGRTARTSREELAGSTYNIGGSGEPPPLKLASKSGKDPIEELIINGTKQEQLLREVVGFVSEGGIDNIVTDAAAIDTGPQAYAAEGPTGLGRTADELKSMADSGAAAELALQYYDLVDSMDAVSTASAAMDASLASSVEAVIAGQESIGHAARAILSNTLKSLGSEAIADGSANILKGLARGFTSYGFDWTAGALIGTGTQQLALGTGLMAGSVATAPAAAKGGGGGGGTFGVSQGSASVGVSRDGGRGGGSTTIIFNNPTSPEEMGRINAYAARTHKRRYGDD